MERAGHHPLAAGSGAEFVAVLVLGIATLAGTAYLYGAVRQRRGLRSALRTALFVAGVAIAAGTAVATLVGSPGYRAHMVAHLLVGMLAPLLMALGAPVTLALGTLHVEPARRLSRLLRLRPVALVSHPVTAGVLDIGGLWLIYTTDLYRASHEILLVGLVVQLHLVGAGYLFAAGIVGADPSPHRAGYGVRAAVLVAAFAAHGVLAKHLIGHPPPGVDPVTAEAGSRIMYYGGDVIEIALLVLLGARWFASVRPGRGGRRIVQTDAALP